MIDFNFNTNNLCYSSRNFTAQRLMEFLSYFCFRLINWHYQYNQKLMYILLNLIPFSPEFL